MISGMSLGSREYCVRLLPKNILLAVREGESVYEAASRQQVRMPVSCRNGVCHICKGILTRGQVETSVSGLKVSVGADRVQEVLLCQTWPKSDCEINVENVYARGELPVKEVVCQVSGVKQLGGHVYEVRLSFSAGKIPEFFAGQYLSLHLPDDAEGSFFSIASAPGGREIELHIQADPHLAKALEIVEHLQQANSVKVKLPFGKACMSGSADSELILAAAGTGFAQMKSIVEDTLSRGFDKPVSLYWGVRQEKDMYLRQLADSWERDYPNFRFVPLVSEAIDDVCTRHHDQMANAICAHSHDLKHSQVFVSGSPTLVFSTLERLEEAGLKRSSFFSDVLEYTAPPEK